MKKTNFFKLLMVGAVTLSLGLASCNYVNEKDFAEVCDRVSAVELSIADLTTKLNAIEKGNYVTDVTKVDGNTIRVTYKTGSPIDIELDGGDGPGPGVGFVKLGDDGNWYIDGKDTGIPAVGPAPKVEDGKWVFPSLNEDNELVWDIEGDSVLLSAYATQINGVWTLYIPNAAGSKFEAIKLPSMSSGLGKIDILGWMWRRRC